MNIKNILNKKYKAIVVKVQFGIVVKIQNYCSKSTKTIVVKVQNYCSKSTKKRCKPLVL